MKLILFVEGRGEKLSIAQFIKRWLDRRTVQPIGVHPVQFEGWAEMVKNIPIKVPLFLERDDVLGVVSLLDLYGPTIYPASIKTARERWTWGREHIEGLHRHERYRHYFACHEFEAWLFSEPAIFPRAVKDVWPKKLKAPEDLNFTKTPKARLNDYYEKGAGKGYRQTMHGKALFARLDPETAADKCPRLKEFLHGLLEMAKPANLVKPEFS